MKPTKVFVRIAIAALAFLSASAFADLSPFDEFVVKHSCKVGPDLPEVRLMNAYLIEKNEIELISERSSTKNARSARLVDMYVLPSYIRKYRLIPGTATLNYFTSKPEVLICIKKISPTVTNATTALTNAENGWSRVMVYRLEAESSEYYIRPTMDPKPVKAGLFSASVENNPTVWITPYSTSEAFNFP